MADTTRIIYSVTQIKNATESAQKSLRGAAAGNVAQRIDWSASAIGSALAAANSISQPLAQWTLDGVLRLA